MDPVRALRRLGGVARISRVVALGASKGALVAACRSGRIVRLRRGWYSLPDAGANVRMAATVGGLVSCVSLLHEFGVWVRRPDELHLAMPPNAARWQHRRPASGTRIHWLSRPPGPDDLRDSPTGALRLASECLDDESAIAAIDSALRLRLTSISELRSTGVPRSLLSRTDPSAESGGETAMRLRLRAIRCRFGTQVEIDGVGRVDFLVGDRLVIEIDGFSVHGTREAFERDRARDRRLVELGYLVMRVTYRHLEEEWPRIERSIRAILRSRRHLDRRASISGREGDRSPQ